MKEQRQCSGAKIVSSTNGIGTTRQPHAKKKKNLDTNLTDLHKNYVKMNQIPKCKRQSYKKHLRDNKGGNLDDLGYGDAI